MAGFIGNKPGAKYATLTRQTFSTPTGTSHTLSQTVTNSDDLLLYINNVKQNPADYTASGTTLTTASLAGGTEMYCLYYGKTTETVAVPASSVGDSHMVDMAASKLTGALPAISGASLTNLPAEGAYKILTGSYAMSVTGSLAITGVGFQPKAFFGFAATGNYSNASWSLSCQSSGVESAVIYDQHAYSGGTADQFGMTVDNLTLFHGSAWHKWTVNSFDSDGITVTRSNHSGSPTNDFTYRILFIK